ncbi:hypothetical protein VNO77_08747 [Canavalia gladiata]|uniref:Uncharacterized protein n=1 Tax=Canavalia gladiata TaxID=3824 RepID=A0AAN9QX47_CANGL
MNKLGRGSNKINPLVPVDLVINHSGQANCSKIRKTQRRPIWSLNSKETKKDLFSLNVGSTAFHNMPFVPPVGVDPHTTMVEGLSIAGWGVTGSMALWGKFVEFYGGIPRASLALLLFEAVWVTECRGMGVEERPKLRRGKEKVVDEGVGLQKPDKGRGKKKVVDEGAGLQKPDKGKRKQKVVDEDSDSWSDEIFDDSDDNFKGLGEDISDESDFDIETMPEDRTDDSDEGLSWISEEIKTINSDNEEMDRE